METRHCPYCGGVISNEAIICKHCHTLFSDDDTTMEKNDSTAADENDVQSEGDNNEVQNEFDDSSDYVDETTKVYSAVKGRDAAGANQAADEEKQIDESVYAEYADDEQSDYESEAYDDEADEEASGSDEEKYPDFEHAFDDYGENISTSDSKRTFIITAIITIGILIIAIAAVAVGYKLFGFDDSSSVDSVVIPTPEVATTTTVAEAESAADSVEEYVPEVTDDTVSEAPEEVYDSSLADPVSEADSTVDSLTDSSSTDSLSDSSSTDTSTDSLSDTTSRTPAGSYFSWDEVMDIMDDYVAEHGGSYTYAYGTDGVEMAFYYTDDNGNTSTVRVDLPTGAISIVG